MDYQIRIRTDESFDDILAIKGWLGGCTEGFAFNHNLPNNNHYHIYLFGLQRTAKTIRETLSRYYEKQCYAVSTTAGKKKEKLEARVAFQYGTTSYLKEPVWRKTERYEQYQLSAQAFYHQQKERQERKSQVVTEMMVITEEKAKVDRVWQQLMEELIETPTKYDGKSIPQIKSIISVEYLRRLKAVPRPSDLHRYAMSLFYIVKHDLHKNGYEIDDDALENEYLR